MTIVVTTWLPPDEEQRHDRIRALRMAVYSWSTQLQYDGRVNLHIADDGTEDADIHQLVYPVWQRSPITVTTQRRRGVGASLNAGFTEALQQGDLVAYFVDDWQLQQPLDITPWAQLLAEDEDIGMVRLGPPHPDLTGQVKAFAQGWALLLQRHNFAFAHRPALYHRRMYDYYGPFKERVNALHCEHDYNQRFCTARGPKILLALHHPWQHLESVELSAVQPA